MAGDRETGVTIHKTTPDLDAGPIAAQRRFPIGDPRRHRGRRRARCRACRRTCSDEVFQPTPVRSAAGGERHVRRQAHRGRPRARPRRAGTTDGLLNQNHALSRPHIGARGLVDGRPPAGLEGAARPTKALSSWSTASSCSTKVRSAQGGQAHERGGVPTRQTGSGDDARGVAYEVVHRRVRGGGVRRSGIPGGGGRLDGRDRAFAMQLAYGAVQRARTLDHAIEAVGNRPTAALDPPVRAALRLARTSSGTSTRFPFTRRRRDRRARSGRAPRARRPFTNAVMRRLAEGSSETLLAGLPRIRRGGGSQALVPRLGRRAWWRDLGADEALALMRAQNEPPRRSSASTRSAGSRPTQGAPLARVEASPPESSRS